MSKSTLLQLTLLEVAQAQKHVSVNESLQALDALVQLAVIDRNLAAPPGSPADGDRYLVASGGSGAWAGKDGQVAVWQDGAWAFHAPRAGWRCWVADENKLLVHDGSAWTESVASGGGREILTANRTYYVRTDGSDSNDGLTDSSGGAFLTLQKAWNTILTLDLNGFTVTVEVGNGTYTAGVNMATAPVGGNVIWDGDTTTPGNVIVSVTGNNGFTLNAPCTVTVRGFELRTTTSGNCLVASKGLLQFDALIFGACAGFHIRLDTHAHAKASSASWTINGNAQRHFSVALNAALEISNSTVTVSGTPAFSSAFAYAFTGAAATWFSTTVTGAATGKRYDVSQNAIVNTFGGGASYFPGDVAGTTATGGQYA